MGTIDGLTKAAMEAIRDNVIVDANIDGSYHLILTKYDGTPVDVGNVRGPQGEQGIEGFRSIEVALDADDYPALVDRFNGLGVWRQDLKALFFWNDDEWLMPHAGIPHTSTERANVTTTECTDPTYSSFSTPLKITSFFKKREDSHLIVRYEGAIINNHPWGEYRVGVHITNAADGTPAFDEFYDIVDGFGDHGPKSCSREIPSMEIPYGHYDIECVRRLVNGVGVVMDGESNNNRNSLTVTETF